MKLSFRRIVTHRTVIESASLIVVNIIFDFNNYLVFLILVNFLSHSRAIWPMR